MKSQTMIQNARRAILFYLINPYWMKILVFYVPCAEHTLNLVGKNGVDDCIVSINFFSLLGHLYSFFQDSTHRWEISIENYSMVSSLSNTRWSCRIDAVRNLYFNFDGVYNALTTLSIDKDQKSGT